MPKRIKYEFLKTVFVIVDFCPFKNMKKVENYKEKEKKGRNQWGGDERKIVMEKKEGVEKGSGGRGRIKHREKEAKKRVNGRGGFRKKVLETERIVEQKTQKHIMEQNEKRKVEKKIEKREFKQKLAGGHQTGSLNESKGGWGGGGRG